MFGCFSLADRVLFKVLKDAPTFLVLMNLRIIRVNRTGFYSLASFGSDDILSPVLSLLVIIISLLTMLSDLKDAPSTVKSTDFLKR